MKILVGDIGGTQTRIRLVEYKYDNTYIVHKNSSYRNIEYNNFIDIIDLFLENIGPIHGEIRGVNFGVAGPIIDGIVKFTNFPWIVTTATIQEKFPLAVVALINDFAAIGYGIETLTADEYITIQKGRFSFAETKSYIGAGTGLGVGFISHQRGQYKVHTTEGGHIDFAPTTDEQIELLKFLSTKYSHVSYERIISGPGLVSVYTFVRSTSAEQENPCLAESIEKLGTNAAPLITKYAMEYSDKLAQHALNLFITIFGSMVGNLALTTLPFGGLYIVGIIATELHPLFKQDTFLNAFHAKGRLANIMKDIPLHVVLCSDIGLRGTALYAKKLVLDQAY